MEFDIKRLLKRKKLTGEEVGQLVFAIFINDAINAQDPNRKPLMTQEEFDLLKAKLDLSSKTSKDARMYYTYKRLYEGIVQCWNRCNALEQQFYNGYRQIHSVLSECYHSDEALSSLDNTPLIMTALQYHELRTKTKAKLEAYKDSMALVICECLAFYLEHPQQTPQPIAEALEPTKYILSQKNLLTPYFNEAKKYGYYQLIDGTRSDQVSLKEWIAAVEKEIRGKITILNYKGEVVEDSCDLEFICEQKVWELYEIIFKGIPYIRELYKKKTGKALPKAQEEPLLNGFKELLEELDLKNQKLGSLTENFIRTAGTWHSYDFLVGGHTLYDTLTIYANAGIGVYKDLTKEQAIKQLRADAPDVFNAIRNHVIDKVPELKGVKSLYKPVISWGELAKYKIADYDILTNPLDEDIAATYTGEDTSPRATSNAKRSKKGIAILNSSNNSELIDSKGYYIEPPSPINSFLSLDTMGKWEKAELVRAKEIMIDTALRYQLAFNGLLAIIEKVYKIPNLSSVISWNLKEIKAKMDAYNKFLYMFYSEPYGSKAERERKQALIKQLFPVMDIEELQPTTNSIDAMHKKIKQLGFSEEAENTYFILEDLVLTLSKRGT